MQSAAFVLLSTLAAAAFSTAALADDDRRGSGYIGEAPLDVALLSGERAVTIAGAVQSVDARSFVVEDGSGTVAVDLKHAAAARPLVGEAVTVLGRFDDGRVVAHRIIREDGSVEVARR